jgi:hypothetical protein
VDFYLQYGHNTMPLSRELIGNWGRGGVILSPRDLERDQLRRFAGEIRDRGGQTLLDPQIYNPRASHPRLVEHAYFPKEYSTDLLADGTSVRRWLTTLRELNEETATFAYLVPGFYCVRVDDLWLGVQETLLETAAAVVTDKPRWATICLSSEALRFEDQFEVLLSRAEQWDVHGYYVVAEHPQGHYLVDDPLWLGNLLLFCAGLKLHGRKVVVGYTSHQNLCLVAANVDAIASGNFINVRSFSTTRFDAPDMGPSRRARWWYYCPQSLSEYTVAFMDIAFQAGVIEHFKPDPTLGGDHADLLFSGALPSSTAWREGLAQRHYLHSLYGQATQARRGSFQETMDAQLLLLETAERYIEFFHRNNVWGQDRDFDDMIDVNRSALGILEKERGFALAREW